MTFHELTGLAVVAAAVSLLTASAWSGAAAALAACVALTAGLGGADALHHFLAGSLGCGLHHVTAWWLACAAPDGLATHGDGFGDFVRCGTEAFDHLDRDFLLGEALDVHHEAFFVQADEADSMTFAARATRTTDAVHVVFGDVRDFVVDDVRQVIDVDAACCDVGGDQCADVTGLEARQRLRTGALALVAVQCHGGDAILGQVVGHVVGAELGACEHQNLAPVVVANDVQQHFLLARTADGVNHLADALHRGVAWRDLDRQRIAQQTAGEFADFVAEGGREQQALLFGRNQLQNLLHVMDEAHVEHTVGFVEDEDFNRGQVQKTLLCQVEQTAGCCHQHVHAALDGLDLWVHAHAAEHHAGLELQVLPIVAHGFFNLCCQFACRSHHQGTNTPAAKLVGRCGTLGESRQHGQRERCCLAGAGLGTCQQILATEDCGNRLLLDRSWVLIALFVHGLKNSWIQP